MAYKKYLFGILIAFIVLIFLLYIKDANEMKKEYVLEYVKCQESLAKEKQILLSEINLTSDARKKESLMEILGEIEKCDGCYSSCGSPCGNKGSRNLGFLEWTAKNTILKLRGPYACAAVCIPYCMEAP